MNFRLVLFIFFISLSQMISGQETAPNYLLYRLNMNMLNPAYAGVSENTEIAVGFRKQSLGLEDDPSAQYASFSRAFSHNLGLGMSIVNQKVFVSKQTDIVIDASYKLQLDRDINLYFGLKAGGGFYAIDYNSLGVNDPLFSSNVSTFSPLIGVGFYLKAERYFLHLSSPNIVLSEIQKPKLNSGGVVISDSVDEKFQMYMGGGYRFSLTKTIDLTPSIFSRVVANDDLLFDVSAVADFSNMIEAGLTYRVDTSLIFSILLKVIDNTHFGYAYESTTSEYSSVSAGAHEFVLKFQW